MGFVHRTYSQKYIIDIWEQKSPARPRGHTAGTRPAAASPDTSSSGQNKYPTRAPKGRRRRPRLGGRARGRGAGAAPASTKRNNNQINKVISPPPRTKKKLHPAMRLALPLVEITFLRAPRSLPYVHHIARHIVLSRLSLRAAATR